MYINPLKSSYENFLTASGEISPQESGLWFNYAPTDSGYGVSSGWDSKAFSPKINDLNTSTYIWAPIKGNEDAWDKLKAAVAKDIFSQANLGD